jgi:hypothetical protein
MSISGSREFRDILLAQKLSLLHILSINCNRLVESLHPVAKDAFQDEFFNTPSRRLPRWGILLIAFCCLNCSITVVV